MAQEGVITKDLSETLKLMAGYRNRFVHFYHEISHNELHTILVNNLSDIEIFVKEIKRFERYKKQQHNQRM